MESSDQGRDYVAVFGVVVVADSIQIGRHDAAVVGAVLSIVAFAEFYAGYFCYGVWFVSRFERSGEERVFVHGLRYHAGVDAA